MRTVMALAWAALAAASMTLAWTGTGYAGGGCHSTTFQDEATTTVELKNNCFGPTVVRIDEGDSITWVNKDAEPHTVTGAVMSFGSYDEFRFDQSVTHTFSKAGVFPYVCVVHPTMVGAVVVGDGGPGEGVQLGISAGGASDTPRSAYSQASGGGVRALEAAGIAGGTLAAVLGIGAAAFVVRRMRRGALAEAG